MQTKAAGDVPSALMATVGTKPVRCGDGDLVDVSNYASGRAVVGTTVFVDSPRWVRIWTLEDDERILLVGQGRQLLHWEPSLESLQSAESRALDWLTEPPVEQP